VTESTAGEHTPFMLGAAQAVQELPTFASVYDSYFSYIWRSVQSLGVTPSQVDDVVQEVFVIAYQKRGTFEGRSSVKTWLYGIALHRARAHRRRAREAAQGDSVEAERIKGPEAARPDHRAEYADAVRVLHAILAELDDDQREVFVLAMLEELTAPEIAEVLGVKLNTVYSRLRLAREAFARAAARHRARDGWRTR
jgi:RNA polymerase sigma-70 factor, ECF subfamily